MRADASAPGRAPTWLRTAPFLFLCLWSSGFVFLKLGLAYAEPFTFLALRYICVLAVLLIACLWSRPSWPANARIWGNLAMVGLLLQAGYFSFAYLSLKSGLSAGTVALITSQQPILVALLAPGATGEKIRLKHWVGLVLGVGGASLVILSTSKVGIPSWTGLTFAVLALLAITAVTLWEKRYGTDVHPITANLVQYAVGLAVTAPLAILLETLTVQWTPGLVTSLAYLVIANSLVAISLLLAMLRHGEASRVSALFFLVPPSTAVVAFLILGERIPWTAWPGMALAAAGIYLVVHSRQKE